MKKEGRKVKIVCTIGPASSSVDQLRKLVAAGMNVARLNFSHGSYTSHKDTIDNIRFVEEEANRPIAVLLDTKGPEIRTGLLKGNQKVKIHNGAQFNLLTKDIPGDESGVFVDYLDLYKEVQAGQNIFIDDGSIHLIVESTSSEGVACRVVAGGELGERKGINVPGAELSVPTLTDKDIMDIKWGIENQVDYIAVSFVRTKDDIMEVRRILEEFSGNAKIIAKIETKHSVINLDGILSVADGMMVARGDLGVEIPTEDVPIEQKHIIEKCRLKGKQVIVATQMLDSMIRNPRPTRAEASDVANAVIDGTDAVMLSGETAGGLYPVESVSVMDKIVLRTEKEMSTWNQNHSTLKDSNVTADAVSHAARDISSAVEAAAIISLTETGGTARMVSKYRPLCPIIAATSAVKTWRQLNLVWGVTPIICPLAGDLESSAHSAIAAVRKESLVEEGDTVVITSGVPLGEPGSTNMVHVRTVGEVLGKGHSLVKRIESGTVCKALSAEEAIAKIHDGDILVVKSASSDYLPAIKAAAAVITEKGGLSSYAGLATLNLDTVSVLGVAGIFETVDDGMTVTADGVRGLVYKGRIS